MDTLEPHAVRVAPGALAAAGDHTTGSVLVVTDRIVGPLHRARLGGLDDAPTFTVTPGEASKSLATIERLLGVMAQHELDRSSTLVALGGGVVGDLGGLAASLYMRGIEVVQCPTSLLAQVDAAVGGKTAVNLDAGRNLAGTFHMPRMVLADIDTLSTLPDLELRSGFGEVVKTALVEPGGELLGLLELRAEELVARDPKVLEEVVSRCVRIKARVVRADEREAGPRADLNLGHTFAHAIETVSGYAVPHGLAVAVGLGLSLATARNREILGDDELPGRVEALLGRLGLPRTLAELPGAEDLDLDAVVAATRLDKKARGGVALLVLPRAAGDLVRGVRIEPEDLRAVMDASSRV